MAAGVPPQMIQPPQMDETQIQAMIAAKVAEITVDLQPQSDAARTTRSVGWYSSG